MLLIRTNRLRAVWLASLACVAQLPSATAQITAITDSRVQMFVKSQAPVPAGACPAGYALSSGDGCGVTCRSSIPAGNPSFAAPSWLPPAAPVGGAQLGGTQGVHWAPFRDQPVILSFLDSGVGGTNQTSAYVALQAKFWTNPAAPQSNTSFQELFGLPYVRQDPGAVGAALLVANWTVDYSVGPAGLDSTPRTPGVTLTGTIFPPLAGTSFVHGKWTREYWRVDAGVVTGLLGVENLPSGAAVHCFNTLGPFTAIYTDTNFIPASSQSGPFTLRVVGRLELQADPAAIEVVPQSEGPSASVSGPGGAIPAAGSGNGAWPTQMPSAPFESSVNVPHDVVGLTAVGLQGLSHSWIGDLQVVLEDPNGVGSTLMHRPGFTGSGAGNSDDFGGGLYTIVGAGGNVFPNTAGAPPASAGVYNQHFGQGGGLWPSGTNSIFNAPMGAITGPAGVWKLKIYDWAGGDTGACTGWTMRYTPGQLGPVAFCTSGTTSNGCAATISATAHPSASFSQPCTLNVSNVEGQKLGVLFYGLNNAGFTPYAWGAGNSFQCVKPPTQRTSSQFSGGTASLCDGSLSLDWNAYQLSHPNALGNPFGAGGKLYAQAWFRDPPAAKSTSLSNAIELTLEP